MVQSSNSRMASPRVWRGCFSFRLGWCVCGYCLGEEWVRGGRVSCMLSSRYWRGRCVLLLWDVGFGLWAGIERGLLYVDWRHQYLSVSQNKVLRILTDGGQMSNPHTILGLTLFMLMTLQLLVGAFTRHLNRLKVNDATSRRARVDVRRALSSTISFTHRWLGRSLFTLALVNGGLGLGLLKTKETYYVVYAVVAGVVWCMVVAVIMAVGKRGDGRERIGSEGGSVERERAEDMMQRWEGERYRG